MFKRIFDIVGATILLLLSLWLWPLIMLAIKLTSPGPVFFIQYRVGYHGCEFNVFKFRTLKHNCVNIGPIVRGDDRITLAGRVLRVTYLDELPQLLNVLRGEMSLIGPRPLPLHFVGFETYTSAYVRRLSVRPGLTGLAQLRGREWWRKKGLQNVFRLDVFYAEHACFLLDLKILFKTVGAVMQCRGT